MVSWGHGSFDVDSSDILPTFLGEGDQEVNGLDEVSLNLISLHGLFADGDLDIDNFFKLEFDGSFKSIMYISDVITFSDGLWGLTSLDEGSSHGSDNGLHQGVRGEENFIFSRPLFNLFWLFLETF